MLRIDDELYDQIVDRAYRALRLGKRGIMHQTTSKHDSIEFHLIYATIRAVREYDQKYHQPFIDAAELMIRARDSGGDDWWQGFDMLEKAHNNYCGWRRNTGGLDNE